MVKPAEMTKVSVTGSKKDLEPVIDELYRLGLLDIEDYDDEELEKGSPFEEAEELSELLVDIRSILSNLPEVESEGHSIPIDEVQERIPELRDEIEEISESIGELETKLSSVDDRRKFFNKLRGVPLDYEDLQGTDTLSVFIGELKLDKFRSEAPDRYELYEGRDAHVVIYDSDQEQEFRDVINSSKKEEYSLAKTDIEGSLDHIAGRIESRKEELKQEIENKKEELNVLAKDWRPTLEEAEEFLEEKVEKAEAPISFATTENAFIAKGWIPAEKYTQFEEAVAEAADARVHVQKEDGDNPPVKHENNSAVQPFESLTDLVSVPRYNELDPSFVLLLTFPLFFGFMIGDFGYGLTTLAVFYGGYKAFPKAADIFKSLMYASVATMFFGLIFGDAFGYIIFGENSILTEVTGIGLFQQIPLLFHRGHHLGQVFEWAVIIGLVHINLGFLLGAYNEYVNHGLKEAFLERGSWMVLEAGALLAYLVSPTAGLPVMAVALALLLIGEGVEGLVEIPSLISNILSYLRIFGVAVAAISLAAVVNSLAKPLFQSGSVVGITLGVVLLVFGHTFNTFIKIMEGFLQGIRLHYVEMFGWFYEGGGKKYAPFGARNS